MTRNEIIFYLAIPFLVLAHPFLWYFITGDNATLSDKEGFIESVTVGLLLIAIICNIISFIKIPKDLPQQLRIWLVLLILGAIYFAGEELSWGQHMFGWETPEGMKKINNQEETNLHNIHWIFDQVPRAVVGLCIFIGGIVLPLIRYFRKTELNRERIYYWALPTLHCTAAGFMATLARPVFDGIFDIKFFSVGEFKECLFALFICVYCLSLCQRLLARSNNTVS